MSIVNFTSGINKIEQDQPLSEWAVEYILKNEITKENLSVDENFRHLPRRQKDAVRYQLRRSSSKDLAIAQRKTRSFVRSKNNLTTFTIAPMLRMALSLWISGFLLVDISQIYISKGLSPFLAWQTAILVELCILAASVASEKRVQKIAYVLLVYNVAIFAFFEVKELVKVYERNVAIKASIAENLILKNEVTQKLENSASFQKNSMVEMSALVKKGYISSVSNAVARMSSAIRSDEESLEKRMSKLAQDTADLESQHKSIFMLGTISILYFLLRGTLQIFCIWLIRGTFNRNK